MVEGGVSYEGGRFKMSCVGSTSRFGPMYTLAQPNSISNSIFSMEGF